MTMKTADRNTATGFFCSGCAETIPVTDSSPDPRYCKGCYKYLANEATSRRSVRKNTETDWVPVRDLRLPSICLAIEPGDRVQSVAGFSDIVDHWLSVETVHQETVALSLPNGNTEELSIQEIISHQKGVINMNKRETTPQENLVKCRETLAKVTAANADPRVIGLWRSKVAQAEAMCQEAGKIEPEKPKPDPVVAAAVAAMATIEKTKKATTPTPTTKRKPEKKAPGPCLCGCGSSTKKGSEFLPGHDARLTSYVRKLDRGEIKLEALPELVQKMVTENHEAIQKIRDRTARL